MSKTLFNLTSANTTNATSQNAAATSLENLELTNTTGTAVFFKIYNKASAPTVGTDVPLITIPVPANSNVGKSWPKGFALPLGFAFAITNLIGDTDATVVAAGALKVAGNYLTL